MWADVLSSRAGEGFSDSGEAHHTRSISPERAAAAAETPVVTVDPPKPVPASPAPNTATASTTTPSGGMKSPSAGPVAPTTPVSPFAAPGHSVVSGSGKKLSTPSRLAAALGTYVLRLERRGYDM